MNQVLKQTTQTQIANPQDVDLDKTFVELQTQDEIIQSQAQEVKQQYKDIQDANKASISLQQISQSIQTDPDGAPTLQSMQAVQLSVETIYENLLGTKPDIDLGLNEHSSIPFDQSARYVNYTVEGFKDRAKAIAKGTYEYLKKFIDFIISIYKSIKNSRTKQAVMLVNLKERYEKLRESGARVPTDKNLIYPDLWKIYKTNNFLPEYLDKLLNNHIKLTRLAPELKLIYQEAYNFLEKATDSLQRDVEAGVDKPEHVDIRDGLLTAFRPLGPIFERAQLEHEPDIVNLQRNERYRIFGWFAGDFVIRVAMIDPGPVATKAEDVFDVKAKSKNSSETNRSTELQGSKLSFSFFERLIDQTIELLQADSGLEKTLMNELEKLLKKVKDISAELLQTIEHNRDNLDRRDDAINPVTAILHNASENTALFAKLTSSVMLDIPVNNNMLINASIGILKEGIKFIGEETKEN